MSPLFIYGSVIAVTATVLISTTLWRRHRSTRQSMQKWQEAQQSGLTEPASLHPLIDPAVCLGCGTCVSACPEGNVLGLVNRKALLVSPSSCIGHGACREACPTGAITLVFGSETKGVEIPMVSPTFETSVPGLFIAGELGGMGLIKNAITQGQQAVSAAVSRVRQRQGGDYDLIIVGAGPAGLSAALAAKQKKLRYVVLEQDTVGGTIAHYPRGKVVMTAPALLPVVGKFQFREASKEQLIEFWQSVVAKGELAIKTEQRVSDIQQTETGFTVVTERASFSARTVLLAMGRRGTPRKLGVEGEHLSKVVYRLMDPEQYTGRRVLVVGGGDSALEAALAIADQPDTQVTLSYRSEAFSRAKAKNRDRVAAAQQAAALRVELQSTVKCITDDLVELITAEGAQTIPNDDVIVCAGGILPTPFLKQIGIHVEEKFGTV